MRPPSRQRAERLRRLEALARLRAEAELARLAVAARSRARLSAALAALGDSEPPLGPGPPAGPVSAGIAPNAPGGGPAGARPAEDRPAAGPDGSAPGTAAAGRSTPERSLSAAAPAAGGAPRAGQPPGPGAGGRAPSAPGLERGGDPSSDTPSPGRVAPVPHHTAEPAWIDPLLVRVRLAHAGWISAQRREINARLAMVQADWLRLQPQAARAMGRAEVLDRLASAAARRRPTDPDG